MRLATHIYHILIILPLFILGSCATDEDEDPDPANDTGNTEIQFTPKTDVYYKLQTMFLEASDKCLEGNRVASTSTIEGASFMDDCQNVTGQNWQFVDAGDGYYRLKTQFLIGENRCLEGNGGVDVMNTLGGAAFMDRCQNVSGQLWKMTEDANSPGYYKMQSQFLESDDKCLEGNLLDPSSTLEGAAFMDTCQDVTGQLWKFTETATPVASTFVPDPATFYKLQTQFKADDNLCFEGNGGLDAMNTLGGSAFMDTCQDVTGQLWKFVDQGNGYYQMRTQFLGDTDCLEGNGGLDENNTLGGAAFMSGCGFSGQLWKIVADSSGYFRLQSQLLEEDNYCLEGNGGLDEANTLSGSAFMDSCQNVTGQLWIIAYQ